MQDVGVPDAVTMFPFVEFKASVSLKKHLSATDWPKIKPLSLGVVAQ